MATFTPEIYKRLGTSVSIDLSSLAELKAVRDGVDALDKKVATADTVEDINSSMSSNFNQADTKLDNIATDATNALNVAKQIANAQLEQRELADARHEQVLEAIAGMRYDPPAPTLDEQNAEVLGQIIELEAALLNRNLPRPNIVNPVVEAIRNAVGDQEADSFVASYKALPPLKKDRGWPECSEVFWALHRLTERIAAKVG